jgi:hypothetical protein
MHLRVFTFFNSDSVLANPYVAEIYDHLFSSKLATDNPITIGIKNLYGCPDKLSPGFECKNLFLRGAPVCTCFIGCLGLEAKPQKHHGKEKCSNWFHNQIQLPLPNPVPGAKQGFSESFGVSSIRFIPVLGKIFRILNFSYSSSREGSQRISSNFTTLSRVTLTPSFSRSCCIRSGGLKCILPVSMPFRLTTR